MFDFVFLSKLIFGAMLPKIFYIGIGTIVSNTLLAKISHIGIRTIVFKINFSGVKILIFTLVSGFGLASLYSIHHILVEILGFGIGLRTDVLRLEELVRELSTMVAKCMDTMTVGFGVL
jgi:hypothetical protein